MPTILAFHGGGFSARSRGDFKEVGTYFAEQGYAFVAANYRLAPADVYPAQVEDAVCALAWVHANAAEHGFDPDRVAVLGVSAGGYLAALIATLDDLSPYGGSCAHSAPGTDAIRAVVASAVIYDLTDVEGIPAESIDNLERYLGSEMDATPPDQLAALSPTSHVDREDPPFLALHGDIDEVVPPWTSERFIEALVNAGGDGMLEIVRDAGHGYELRAVTDPSLRSALRAIEEFLATTLVVDG